MRRRGGGGGGGGADDDDYVCNKLSNRITQGILLWAVLSTFNITNKNTSQGPGETSGLPGILH